MSIESVLPSIPGYATWSGPPNFPRLNILTPQCSACIYLQGGQITAWRPAGEDPVLFLSSQSNFAPGKAIRGGVPICFPWFGLYTLGPPPAGISLPQHGFARTFMWEVESLQIINSDIELAMILRSNAATRQLWAYDFLLRHRFRCGSQLTMQLEITNTGDSPFKMEVAQHSYFSIADIAAVEICGLEGVEYLDKTDGGRRKILEGTIRFHQETDRVYVNTDADCELLDTIARRKIHIQKTGSRSTVIWNPWVEKAAALADMKPDDYRFLACIETANAGENGIFLGPRQTHLMQTFVTVQPIG